MEKELRDEAKELVEKFRTLTMVWDVRKESWEENIKGAKQCALICVDEIIVAFKNPDNLPMELDADELLAVTEFATSAINHYTHLKQAIKEL